MYTLIINNNELIQLHTTGSRTNHDDDDDDEEEIKLLPKPGYTLNSIFSTRLKLQILQSH